MCFYFLNNRKTNKLINYQQADLNSVEFQIWTNVHSQNNYFKIYETNFLFS